MSRRSQQLLNEVHIQRKQFPFLTTNHHPYRHPGSFSHCSSSSGRTSGTQLDSQTNRTNVNLQFGQRYSQKLKANAVHLQFTHLYSNKRHFVNIRSLSRDIIWYIIDFVAFSEYKRIALINLKWNRALNTHHHIFRYYRLDFGDTFKSVYNGKPFQVTPNHKELKLSISLQTNPLTESALSVPYFYRCSKWILFSDSNCTNNSNSFNDKTFKYFRSNAFVTSCVIFCSKINALPLKKAHISRLNHLTLTRLHGTVILKELVSLDVSRLLCLEITDINLCENDEIANVLNCIFKKCLNLIFFKFSAHNTRPLRSELDANKFEIKTVKFPLKLQWISLTLFSNYFDIDLSANNRIIGLHIRDKQLRIESITWPKYGYIQCLTLESFRGYTSDYIASWNHYIDLDSFKMKIRFIKAIKYPFELQIESKYWKRNFSLLLNESCVANVKETMRDIVDRLSSVWTLESYALLQNDFNNLGPLNNPYLLTPIYFKDIKAMDRERLFQILLRISHLEYDQNYKIYEQLLLLKSIKWVGSFGRSTDSN